MTKFYIFNQDFRIVLLAEDPIQAVMFAIAHFPPLKFKAEYITVTEHGFSIRIPDYSFVFSTREMLATYKVIKKG